MRDILSDWKYLCSSDNTTSRGFYLFLAIMCILTLLIFIACIVLSIMKITGIVAIIISLVAVALSWGPAVFLSLKS